MHLLHHSFWAKEESAAYLQPGYHDILLRKICTC
jgi:hypothetical protein